MTAPEARPRLGRQPLTIQLEVEFLDRLSEPVREGKVASVSDLIRAAVERFNFEQVLVAHASHLPISVRLADEVRRTLKRVAKAKHTSIGHLVRAAVEAYLPELEGQSAGQMEMPIEASSPAAPPAKRRKPASRRRKPPPARRKSAAPAPRKRRAMTRKRKG